MQSAKNKARDYAAGFSFEHIKRKTKSDWAGISIGDAFNTNLQYYIRMPAQRNFYKLVRQAQLNAARLNEFFKESSFEPAVKPQIGPCYTSYPSTLAAYASIGLTAYKEFEKRAGENILLSHLKDYLKNPAEADRVKVNEKAYKLAALMITESVQTRLLLETLSRVPSLTSVELYRLFSASQHDMRFTTLKEIIRTAILYGDLLPDLNNQKLHPLTKSILINLIFSSASFFEEIRKTETTEFLSIGMRWVKALCGTMSPYCSFTDEDDEEVPDIPEKSTRKTFKSFLEQKLDCWINRNNKQIPPRNNKKMTDEIAPLCSPVSPILQDPKTAFDVTIQGLLTRFYNNKNNQGRSDRQSEYEDTFLRTLNNFSALMEKTLKQENTFEDMRSDLVENSVRINPFDESPIQGNPAEGNEISVIMGGGDVAVGEIFDRHVELSEDMAAFEKLLEQSDAITRNLKRNLYPDVQKVAQKISLRCSGSLDASRLVLADFSSVIFKRYRTTEQTDMRGRPVLVIACDGSSSLNDEQIKMVKVLSAGWLRSTAGSQIQVLAGLYHSGKIRKGVTDRPLVQWFYHPRKVQAYSRIDSVRAIVSLPDSGTGIQSDALSIAFMVEEGKRLAKSAMVYLILITDTEWNSCFGQGGYNEVRSYFEAAYDEMNGRLHTTLVALGVSGSTMLETIIDNVITVSDEELNDSTAVASKINSYVVSVMKERSLKLCRR